MRQERLGRKVHLTGRRRQTSNKQDTGRMFKGRQERDSRQTMYRQKTGGMIQKTCRLQNGQETGRNG
jgi:hypothetical protein